MEGQETWVVSAGAGTNNVTMRPRCNDARCDNATPPSICLFSPQKKRPEGRCGQWDPPLLRDGFLPSVCAPFPFRWQPALARLDRSEGTHYHNAGHGPGLPAGCLHPLKATAVPRSVCPAPGSQLASVHGGQQPATSINGQGRKGVLVHWGSGLCELRCTKTSPRSTAQARNALNGKAWHVTRRCKGDIGDTLWNQDGCATPTPLLLVGVASQV